MDEQEIAGAAPVEEEVASPVEEAPVEESVAEKTAEEPAEAA